MPLTRCIAIRRVQKNEQTLQVLVSIEAQKVFVDKLYELTTMIKRGVGSAQAKVSDRQ